MRWISTSRSPKRATPGFRNANSGASHAIITLAIVMLTIAYCFTILTIRAALELLTADEDEEEET